MMHILKGQFFGVALILFISCNGSNDWSNWGNTQVCTPREIFNPTTKEEVQAIIKQASKFGIQVRAVGSGHSWSDVVCTNGYLIMTDHLKRIIKLDKKNMRVTVEGGIKIKDLVNYLAEHDLALSNQGFIVEQSIAGALATATHGSGHTGTLSDFIVEAKIIDGTGQLQQVSSDSHPEWLPAVRVGLGAAGFVYSVTLQCEPLFALAHKRIMLPLEEVLAYYKQLYEKNDFCTFMVHPKSRKCLVYLWNKTAKPVTRNFLYQLKNNVLLNHSFNYALIKSMAHFPTLGNKCFARFLETMQEEEHIEYSYTSLSPLKDPLTTDCYIESEFAIPTISFTHVVQKVLDLCDAYERRGIPLFIVLTCRFGPAQKKAYMSPNYGRDTAYININIFNRFPAYEEFFKDFERIVEPFHGRPHWGKFHLLTKEKIASLYGPNFKKFNEVRRAIDSQGTFVNNFITRCFGNDEALR